jgi:hypothetical protein
MTQNDLTRNQPMFKISPAVVLSVALWLVAIVLAMLCVFAARELFLWGLGVLIPQPDTRSRLQAANFIDLAHQCFMLILGVADIILLMGISEYFFRHIGQARLLRTLALVIAIESAIVLPVYLFFWRQ